MGGWLALTAVAYAVMHHVGSVPEGFGGAPGQTRWADWIDLLTPYLVLAPAVLAMRAARPRRRIWVLFAVGAVMYAQGHGIHLSANSIGNVAPGAVVHLWDEQVGHLVWYTGVALVTAALALGMRGQPRPDGIRLGAACALSVLAGAGTWATNAVGGGTVAASLIVAASLAVFGWRARSTLAVVLLPGYPAASVVLLVVLVF